MAIFTYKAFDRKGNVSEGHIEAVNQSAAQKKLKSQNLYVKEIKEDIAKRDRVLFPFLAKLIYRIPRKEIGLFVKQLGTLLGAGIPLDEAVNDVWEQTSNPHLKKVVAQIKEDIVQGKSLSEAIAEHGAIFPPVYESMIKVGEATGSYEATLNRLAELEEKNADLRNKTMTALIYPGIMFVLMLTVVTFLLTSVVPQIKILYANFNANDKLPLPTKVVMGLSSFVDTFWPLMILLAFAGMYLFYRYRQTTQGRLKVDRFLLNMPVFGSLMVKIQVGRFSRNLGVLLENRVPLLSAIEIVAGTVGNEIFKQELLEAGEAIREGSSMRDALKNSEVLPHMAKGMMSAGESTDRMAELLLKVAQIMETDVDTGVKGLTNSLEPIMIIVMGVVVGGIMASVMMPLYKMSELIK